MSAAGTTTTGGATSATTPVPSTHPYTCNTCQVAFRSSEGQRNHMHTDWHRYNLKRRITELPPISSESFAEKVLSSQASSRLERERASFEKPCQACSRTYYSENAYANHINSGKHKTRVSALERIGFKDGDGTESVVSSTFSMGEPDDEELEGVDEDEVRQSKVAAEDELSSIVKGLKVSDISKTPTSSTPGDDSSSTPRIKTPNSSTAEEKNDEIKSLPITECLFCTNTSDTLEQNIEHMTGIHGLFIPEKKYLVNLEGLIKYLGQKVLVGNTCLYCNKGKGGLDGIRTHMRDKNHCKIAFESEEEMLEVGEFYDFRSSYGDEEGDWEDEDNAGETVKEKGEEGWETDSDDSSLNSEDLGSVPVDQPRPHISRHQSHHLEDGWHSHAHSHSHIHAVYHTDYELHLPSGRTVGHRSLARYYRQNLHNSEVGAQPNQNLITDGNDVGGRSAALTTTRENGGLGLAGAPLAVRKQAVKLEKKDRKIAERGRNGYQAIIEKKNNSQKHYRDPLLQ